MPQIEIVHRIARTTWPRVLGGLLLAATLGLGRGPVHADDGFVGPDFVEDSDSGNTIQTAAKVRGQGNGVNTVNGGLDGGGGFARGGPVGDFQDVYLIYIRDASGFAARTIGPIGDATFDTRLFLFRPDGRGLLAADDADQGNQQTTLKADPSSIPGPGVYALAIVGAPVRPVTEGGLTMFPQPPFGQSVGPTDAGAILPLVDWAPFTGEVGTYRIALEGVAFIPEPCGEGGDCFLPNPEGPGCADLSCCSRVCDLDPFCCGVAWDLQCANIARATCVSCGNPAAGSCLEPRPIPYCDDADCCRIVCEIDPSCCDAAWDKACVAIATSTCKPDPCNRECPGDFNNDRLRDGADLGLLLGGWGEGGCTDLNEDGNTDGADLGLLLGSLGPCPACGVPDAGGCLNANATPGCEDANCCGAVCMVDPACCSDAWDFACASQARQVCAPACGNPDAGPCNETHLAPGCSDPVCCAAVCELLPRCCAEQWDEVCVKFAAELEACID